MAESKTRFNITLSGDMKEYYSQLADEMGISISQCMVVALKFYKDAQESKALIMNSLPDMINQLQLLEKSKNDK